MTTDLLISREELAGRIEGMGLAFLHLVAILETSGVMEGETLTAALRKRAELREQLDSPLPAAVAMLHDLADQLDAARTNRQAAGRHS